jgi:uncharacterized protein YegL
MMMPVSLTKKPKASTALQPVKPLERFLPESAAELTSCLDPSNRTTRTPLGWITDGSPSMTGFTEVQLTSAKSMVVELRELPITSRSVLMNIVQIGSPPVATGFQEISKFQVPCLHAANATPFHLALDRMASDLGALFSDLRTQGIERTESVVIITTDGFANAATSEVIQGSIDNFLNLGKKWSITNLVVGVGSNLNEPLLKNLANNIPPLQIEELNAACLMPFIQKVVAQFSQSRRGQKIEIEVPDGIEVME